MASKNLPSRGQVAFRGTSNGVEFQAVLEPDGYFGHWMRVDDTLQDAAGISVGDTATMMFGRPSPPGCQRPHGVHGMAL